MQLLYSIVLAAALATGIAEAKPSPVNHNHIARGSSSKSESCGSNEFWYSERSCCLTQGGPSKTPSPPSGKSCPSCTSLNFFSESMQDLFSCYIQRGTGTLNNLAVCLRTLILLRQLAAADGAGNLVHSTARQSLRRSQHRSPLSRLARRTSFGIASVAAACLTEVPQRLQLLPAALTAPHVSVLRRY